MYTAICDQPLTVGAQGEVICSGTLFVSEHSPTLADLSMGDVSLLLSGTLALFAMAFGIKMIFRMFFPPGRS